MKVIFHIGKTIGSDTIVTKGFLDDDTQGMYIAYGDRQYFLNDIKSVDFYKLNLVGTMIRLQNGNDTVFVCVPRLYINKGTGFVIVNYGKTKKLKRLLDLAMALQNKMNPDRNSNDN